MGDENQVCLPLTCCDFYQELRTLGLPSIVTQVDSEVNTAKVIVVLQKLLSLRRHNLKVIDEQRDKCVVKTFVFLSYQLICCAV